MEKVFNISIQMGLYVAGVGCMLHSFSISLNEGGLIYATLAMICITLANNK